ncbi:MAG: DnaJ domain-containing protein [Alphaproteobacteria bacterium]
MPRKYNKSDFAPQIDADKAPLCESKGCSQPGTYKAPRSRDALDAHQWLCLDHIREHNQRWDFFDGMDRDEIELFMRDAVTGHRPTWDRDAQHRRLDTEGLRRALNDFMGSRSNPRQKLPPEVPGKVRKALSVLDLEYPYTVKALKTHYRQLVKKHHPDRHQGDKKAEDIFKRITQAYECLMQHAKNS